MHPHPILEIDPAVAFATGQHMDMMAEAGNRAGQLVDVTANATHPAWRVFLADEHEGTPPALWKAARESEERRRGMRYPIGSHQPPRATQPARQSDRPRPVDISVKRLHVGMRQPAGCDMLPQPAFLHGDECSHVVDCALHPIMAVIIDQGEIKLVLQHRIQHAGDPVGVADRARQYLMVHRGTG